MLGDADTIAAIGTAPGVGALGIVRISGSKTQEVLKRCFNSSQTSFEESHRAYYGFWNNPDTESAVDEVLVLNFTNRKGFTGEDAVDVICHGGVQVVELVLDGALKAGARLARPGEFTYRAVMNNKIDLARAESVLELIQANSPRAAASALRNIRGGLSESILKIESDVVFVLANLEASIDFTTEDIQPVDMAEMLGRIQLVRQRLRSLVESYVNTQVLRHGFRVALVGQPNVGKSSLLNALTGKRRSIVADSPGTTRDTIEEDMIVEGLLFRLIDTAGLREVADAVESEGIERAREEIASADLVLFVVDAQSALSNLECEEIRAIGSRRAVICFNKSDVKDIDALGAMARFGLVDFKFVKTSALTAIGTHELRATFGSFVKEVASTEVTAGVSTLRQKEHLERADQLLERSAELLTREASPEFVAFELKEVLLSLQNVLGKNAGDDVMDRVFKEFCIGK